MLYNIVFLIISVLITSSVFAQELAKEITDDHIQIEGTNIFMVPPEDFNVSTNFKGFQNPDDPTSMIMIVEIPGPYDEVKKGFSSEMLETRGMKLQSKKDIAVSQYAGLLLELDQMANGMVFSKQILIYGDKNSTTLINGVYIKDSIALGKEILASVLTSFVDVDIVSDPRNALDYTVDEGVGSLKFHSVIGNSMLFNRDLKTPTESYDKATLICDKSFQKLEIEDKKSFCLARLDQYNDPFVLDTTNEVSAVEIDGLKGYELFAMHANNENEKMLQVILFEETGGYFLFVGTYEKDVAISDLQKVIQTFKRKE